MVDSYAVRFELSFTFQWCLGQEQFPFEMSHPGKKEGTKSLAIQHVLFSRSG